MRLRAHYSQDHLVGEEAESGAESSQHTPGQHTLGQSSSKRLESQYISFMSGGMSASSLQVTSSLFRQMGREGEGQGGNSHDRAASG